MYLQYTPSSKGNLSSKIIEKSEAIYFFHVSQFILSSKTPRRIIRRRAAGTRKLPARGLLELGAENAAHVRHGLVLKVSPLREVFRVDCKHALRRVTAD